MKRATIIMLMAAILAVGGCGNQPGAPAGAMEDGEPVVAPTTTESDLINDSNEIANDPDMSAQEKVDAICQEMEANGSFDDGVVSREEVGC